MPMESTVLVTMSPTKYDTAPSNMTGRGPNRSTSRPVIRLSQKNENVVIPKTMAVSPLPVPKSAAIDSKNEPKLYTVPSVTAEAKKVAATTSQARVESSWAFIVRTYTRACQGITFGRLESDVKGS